MDTKRDLVEEPAVPRHGGERARACVAITMDHALAKSALSQLIAGAKDLELVEDPATADVVVVDLDNGAPVERTDESTRRPAVVGLTAKTTPAPIVEALRGGVASVVSTAAPPDELLQAIRLAAAGEMYFDGRVANVLVSQLRARAHPAKGDDRRSLFADLSEREQTVLRLVAEGRTGPEIGRLLGITAKTVDTYRHRIHEKIGLMHRRDYIHFALQIGLLER